MPDQNFPQISLLLCPKHRVFNLQKSSIADNQLSTYCCPHCSGHWINIEDYENWQLEHGRDSSSPDTILENQDLEAKIPVSDQKAGLCPECQRYLTRTIIPLKTPFSVERCSSCNGVWLDAGKWDILTQLGLESDIEKLFLKPWQANLRQKLKDQKEREIITEKLGSELADKVFAMATELENHPSGDCGLSYLIQYLHNSPKIKDRNNFICRRVQLGSYRSPLAF